MEEKLREYFEAFSNKDIQKLSEMFSDDVVLTDWNIHAVGKEQVLEENKKIFDSVETILVYPHMVYYAGSNVGSAAAVEIVIEVTPKESSKLEELHVVDVITFDNKGLISSVKAYKK